MKTNYIDELTAEDLVADEYRGEGYEAALRGQDYNSCPYMSTRAHDAWQSGHRAGSLARSKMGAIDKR